MQGPLRHKFQRIKTQLQSQEALLLEHISELQGQQSSLKSIKHSFSKASSPDTKVLFKLPNEETARQCREQQSRNESTRPSVSPLVPGSNLLSKTLPAEMAESSRNFSSFKDLVSKEKQKYVSLIPEIEKKLESVNHTPVIKTHNPLRTSGSLHNLSSLDKKNDLIVFEGPKLRTTVELSPGTTLNSPKNKPEINTLSKLPNSNKATFVDASSSQKLTTSQTTNIYANQSQMQLRASKVKMIVPTLSERSSTKSFLDNKLQELKPSFILTDASQVPFSVKDSVKFGPEPEEKKKDQIHPKLGIFSSFNSKIKTICTPKVKNLASVNQSTEGPSLINSKTDIRSLVLPKGHRELARLLKESAKL